MTAFSTSPDGGGGTGSVGGGGAFGPYVASRFCRRTSRVSWKYGGRKVIMRVTTVCHTSSSLGRRKRYAAIWWQLPQAIVKSARIFGFGHLSSRSENQALAGSWALVSVV